jgi:hypothetical protein
MNLFLLSNDIVGDLMGPTMMDFAIPGLIAGFVGAYVFYKLALSWGWL